MITAPQTIQQIKQLISEILFNKTSKVSKISDDSVVNALLYGMAKPLQKGQKDIALTESHLFPEFAYGINLDLIAKRQGVSDRFGACGSSTFVRIVVDNTKVYTYSTITNIFTATNGSTFQLDYDITPYVNGTRTPGNDQYDQLTNFGYTYAKVRSVDSGSKTNIDPLTLTTVASKPTGHLYCINDFMGEGGLDAEDDDTFRKRIQEAPNFISTGTIAQLNQVFIKINSNILRTIFSGIDDAGRCVLSVVTCNGIDLTQDELDVLLNKGKEYFSITDQQLIGTNSVGVTINNIITFPVDIDFRVELYQNINSDDIRKNIQQGISNYLDFRFWDYTKKVEWDNILEIVKSTDGVKYVPDQFFIPNLDLVIEKGKLPRLRSFIMRDSNGNIIENTTSTLNPIYYQNYIDISFISTVLSSI